MVGFFCTVRSTKEFLSQADGLNAMPSLAWMLPGALLKIEVALGAANPFTAWSSTLLTIGLCKLGKVPLLAGIMATALVIVVDVLFSVAFA